MSCPAASYAVCRQEALNERVAVDSVTPAAVAEPDNALSADYFAALMGWLVRTGQVAADAAKGSPPDTYWTNEIAL